MIQLALEYVIVSFALGAVWHVVLFAEYYKKLAIYSRIENPRFVFGFTAMLLQSVVLSYVYQQINSIGMFSVGLFLTLESFMVFAEAGKQNTNSLSGFVFIQTAFCLVQTALVALVYYFVPIFI